MADLVPFLQAALGRTVSVRFIDERATQIVSNALTVGKAQQDAAYRDRQRELHEFYDGVFLAANEALIKIHFAHDAERLNSAYAGHDALNIVQMMTRTLAVVFHARPETHLCRASTGERLGEDDPRVRQWRRDEADLSLPATLKQLDAYTTLFRTCVQQIEWRKGRLRWTVHPPYRTFVVTDPDDPAHIDDAIAVIVEMPMPVSSVGTAAAMRYQTWMKDGGEGRMYIHDQAGAVYSNPLFADNRARYANGDGRPVYPFVVWRDATPSPNAFWLPERQDWWAKQRQINMGLVDLWNTMHHQGFSTPHFRNWAGEDKVVPHGPGTPVVTTADGQFEYVTPQPNVGALEDVIENSLRRAAVSDGLPSDTWTKDGATRNLGALKLLRQPLEERRKERVVVYDAALRRAWRLTQIVGDYHASEGGRVRYGPDLDLEVVYPELPEVQDELQHVQALEREMSMGLRSPVDEIMRRENLTREGATARLRQIAEERAEYAVRTPRPEVADPEPRQPPYLDRGADEGPEQLPGRPPEPA